MERVEGVLYMYNIISQVGTLNLKAVKFGRLLFHVS